VRVLELGSYVVPAYAGMILAEQGHAVTKWTVGRDPILSLRRGADLWEWINHGKVIEARPAGDVLALADWPDVVLDNFRPSTLARWGIDPAALAGRHGVVWVSMRAEVGERSFDAVAQARSWMEYGDWLPFYVGDTAAGLWMAFKAAATRAPGHYPLGQASCLQKLVEGELILDAPRGHGATAWDDPHEYGPVAGGVGVTFKGERIEEPARDRAWKLAHLWHDRGRIRI
jgi:hypothetical protein